MTKIFFLVVVALQRPNLPDPYVRTSELGWYETRESCEDVAKRLTYGVRAGVCLEGYVPRED